MEEQQEHYDPMDFFKPVENALTAPWNLQITSEQLAKLKAGYSSADMNDKWMIAFETKGDKTLVHIARSWTGRTMYVLTISEAADGGGAEIETLTWDETGGHMTEKTDEAEAKGWVVRLCKSHLGCDLS